MMNYVLEEVKNSEEKRYGVAFDIGTTTVVGYLWNLSENQMVDMLADTNPQSRFGADVISRINCADRNPENLREMQRLIIRCCNKMLDTFSQNMKVERDWIRKAAVVGNTTMSHLFLGMDPSMLASFPFQPAFKGPIIKTAEEMELHMNDSAEIFVLPNIAGHVGSDIVGVMIASGIKKKQGINLVIDIGTNGEIVLNGKGRILACSTAAGPAFEGARIYRGMRASDGAIERVKIDGGKLGIEVIGGKAPKGICGSGLIDAVAMMLNAGILNSKGNLISKEEALQKGIHNDLINRLRTGVRGNEFILSWRDEGEDIVINQKDIREVQLAKGAIYAGILVLLECLGQEVSKIDEILLAGAFGSYIDVKSALRIGLLPDVNEERIQHIGNAAGTGAGMMLLSEEAKRDAILLAGEVEHIELALQPDFEKQFLTGMYFPQD
ncbi:MAG: ASKHA domain-containing protein [Eubacteriales bacterium]|nr:ASKHA domain-containing protein [Eubacteriales bacterium]MDD3198725.1 ASKHA domain-containing protein [Eubacteriales bacterium]MDD4629029.1 ASKHA domain-containing protein [Eubacteriales bacterium]